MAFVTTGLTGGGITTHYAFQYDDSLGSVEPARTNAVIAACENDYSLMSGWFGGGLNVTGMTVQVTTDSNGASWSGSATSSTVQLKPGGASYTNDPTYLRYLLVAEVTEIFMMAQNIGWFVPSHDEGSKGEGLSRFLSAQFLVTNGLLTSGSNAADIQRDFAVAGLWLNSTRDDFVNNAPDDNGYDATNGCTTLFLYYLFHQLGFSMNQIVAAGAPLLSGVYKNLTGDTGDPFPFFKSLLDDAFPSQSGNKLAGPNFDDPYPLGRLSFIVDKSSFGKDEVNDLLTPPHTPLVPNALWLELDGFNQQVLGGATPALSGAATSLGGISISPDPVGTELERPTDLLAPQRVRFPFDVGFDASALGDFPAVGGAPREALLGGSIGVAGASFSAATLLELVGGADPYFTNVDPAQHNVAWLSQDLRVFTATPGLNPTPVPGGPAFTTDSFAGAYAYIQSLLAHLNQTYSDPGGTDPFNPASNVLPGQAAAYNGDSSVTPATRVDGVRHANYNFAIARVRLRGSAGVAGEATDVRVFFRLWATQTTDADFLPSTYPSHTDASGLPDWPLAATFSQTVPCFATGNAPNFSDPNNPELGNDGINNRTIVITTGDSRWTYYGCFLNVYDPSNVINGFPIQALLPGSHHCLVAQIAYDGAPIVNANGVTENPGNSDKLAQRNLQVTFSDNPGAPATRVVPQTFDTRPSRPPVFGQDLLLKRPDELMIDWGNTPLGSTAHIYWPQVSATQVLQLASRLYPTHTLAAADANTLMCKTTRGVTYVPIPPDSAAENFAGLLTVDLPPGITRGEEFNVVVRRVTTRRLVREASPEFGFAPRSGTAAIVRPDPRREINWRYVTGTFQVRIPVSTRAAILPGDEDLLAILKWRLQTLPSRNRWQPVLQRYVEYVSARVAGLGGDPSSIPPSPGGAPGSVGVRSHSGKVCEVLFDCFGDLEGFVLEDCDARQVYKTHERGLVDLLLRACEERLWVTVYGEHEGQVRRLAIGSR